MKRWLKLGIILSIIIIAFKFILRFILFKIYIVPLQEKLKGPSQLTPIIQFPGEITITIISSIIIGFAIGILINLIHKERKNENSKSIR
jgi:hypothetical protein